jgi:hypothetical protein
LLAAAACAGTCGSDPEEAMYPPKKFDAINPEELAKKEGVDRAWLSPRRHCMMDHPYFHKTGDVKDFEGVKMVLVAQMTIPSTCKVSVIRSRSNL